MTFIALLALIAQLTPGVVRPVTVHTVCATRWGMDRRHVTTAMKKAVFAAYDIPWSRRKHYEVDHLIPRELGGADDVKNLWPQPWPDAHVKDQRENFLHRAVCTGAVTLANAQEEMRHWGQR